MKNASLFIQGGVRDEIFDTNSLLSRDNGFLAWSLLRQKFLTKLVEIHTSDLNSGSVVDFEIHVDAWFSKRMDAASYLILFETPQVLPANGKLGDFQRYRKIFTWRDDLIDGERFVKLNFPNPIRIAPVDGFLPRNRFCCLIAGNKTLPTADPRNLYPERVKAIRWFERYAPQDFDLYGTHWDIPELHNGWLGKVERRMFGVLGGLLNLRPFPSYKGRIKDKREVLSRTKFSICYENVRDLPGYITEKIFDCFFSGCVPVYWGANNITDYIPAKCFVDRRSFDDTQSVYKFLKEMPEDKYIEYQECIAEFLQSGAAHPFGAEFFAETIVNTIVQDLALQP